MNNEVTFIDWIKQLANLRGGWAGVAVMLATIICTAIAAYYGVDLFPAGKYPRILLALPGLAAGAIVFFVLAFASWATFGKTAAQAQKPIAKILILLLFGLLLLALGLWIVRFLFLSQGGDNDWIMEWLMCFATLGMGAGFFYAAFNAFQGGEQQRQD